MAVSSESVANRIMFDLVFCVLATMHLVYCVWQSGTWTQDDQTAPNHRAAAADASTADTNANAGNAANAA